MHANEAKDGLFAEKRGLARRQDFRYAFGLARWLGRFAEDIALTGIELEGHRIYEDLHSRKEHAEAFASEVDGATVEYRVTDFLAYEADLASIDVAFFFFHTADERARQLEILEICGFELVSSTPAKSGLVDYALEVPERTLTVARRPAA